jgi:hypothetical protein
LIPQARPKSNGGSENGAILCPIGVRVSYLQTTAQDTMSWYSLANTDLAFYLQAELDKKRTETEQSRKELESLRKDQDHYKNALESKNKEISFLKAMWHSLPKASANLPCGPARGLRISSQYLEIGP